MLVVSLKGYVGEKRGWPRFKLDLDSHTVQAEWLTDANQAQSRAAGVGAYVKCGKLFHRRKSFVALYALEGALYLCMDSRRWNLMNDDVLVERGNTLLGLKRFRVIANREVEWECVYFTLDYETFPDEDILWYVARSTSDQRSRVRTMLMWQDIANGSWEWSSSYNNGLDQRVSTYLSA
jgi:hypothetical protein